VAGDTNFPIDTAAINWVDSSGEVHIRVYSSDGYTVTERCWDGSGWSNGSFSQAGSVVSATSWQASDGLHIRVYCTNQDATVEWCIDQGGGWYQGAYTTT
jgi:Fungal fucose-specific lectin